MVGLPIVLVTCASGSVGREVVKSLSQTGKFSVRAGVRDVAKAQSLFAGLPNVQVVPLEKDPKASFEGIYGLFLLIANPFPGDTTFDTWLKEAIDHKVQHLVFNSSLTASDAGNPVITNQITGAQNIEIEKSGLPYTFLKPTFYSQNTDKFFLPQIKQGKIIGSSHGGRFTVVDVRDIGASAAKVFENRDAHLGKQYYLTAQFTDDYEHTKLLTEAGVPVEYVDISRAEFKEYLAKTGLPDIAQGLFMGLAEEKELELTLPVRDDLAQLLGRPAIPYKQYIDEFAAAYKANKY